MHSNANCKLKLWLSRQEARVLSVPCLIDFLCGRYPSSVTLVNLSWSVYYPILECFLASSFLW